MQKQKDLISKIYDCVEQRYGAIIPKYEIKAMLDGLGDAVNQCVENGEEVTIPNVITLSIVDRAAKAINFMENPKVLPPRKGLKYRLSTKVQESLDKLNGVE
jgi:nucleoid DNA-binding protein